MKLSNTISTLLIFISIYVVGQAPKYGHSTADGDYYMFPIRPNQPNSLAGNMGELRTSHFHAGLDIRTGGRSGLPVYAAADGYVSRISISAGGYGKAIYITHSNGETTVYAHLERFDTLLDKYTKKEQYKLKKLHVKLYPKKNELLVKKGSIIAYSGNSGSSGGPHLHFEIRDKNHTILNPLNYNFEEIRDTIEPTIIKLALTPFSTTSRINDTFDRIEIKAKKVSNVRYSIEDTIEVFGEIGFELLTYDKLNGANYKCGVPAIEFYINEELVHNQIIDSLSFAKQRNVLTHYNYPTFIKSGEKFHKLYVADGNMLDVYESNSRKGKMVFSDGKYHTGLIKVMDVMGNSAILEFVIKSKLPLFEVPTNKIEAFVSQTNNILVINNTNQDSIIQITSNLGSHSLSPDYRGKYGYTYLWDLSLSPLNRIDFCDSLLILEEITEIPSTTKFDFYSKNIHSHFRKNSLFDTLFYYSKYSYDSISKLELLEIGNPKLYPLKGYIDITASSLKLYDPNRTHAYKVDKNNYNFIGGKYADNQLIFSVREFGKYTLLTDSIPPEIMVVTLSNNKLKFKISDNLSGIKEFNVYVNDTWILMDYDYKTNYIWSDDFEKPLTENSTYLVKAIVTDRANNETIYTSNLE